MIAIDGADHTLWVGYNSSPAGVEPNVTLVDLTDGQLLGQLPDTPNATSMLFDPSSGRMYVGESLGPSDGALAVFNATTNAPVAPPIPVQPDPDGMVIDPYSGELWVVSGNSGNLTAISTASLTARTVALPPGTLLSPEQASSITYDPVNGDLYALCEGYAATVFVLNGSTGAAAAPAIVEPNSFTLDTNILYDPADQRVFVLVRNESFGSVLEVIDPEIQAAVGEIGMENGPLDSNVYSNSMVLDPSTGSIVLAGARWWESGDEGYLGVMDPLTGLINWSSGYSGPGPFAQALDPASGIDYVSHEGMDFLTAVNLSDPSLGAQTIVLGGSPYAGTYDPEDGSVVLPEAFWNSDPVDGGSLPNGIVLLPPSSTGTASAVPIGPNASSLAGYAAGYAPDSAVYDPELGALFVAGYRSNQVVELNATTDATESNRTLPFAPVGGVLDPADHGLAYANTLEVALLNASSGNVTSYSLPYPCYYFPAGPQEDVAVNPTTGVVYFVPGADGCLPNVGMVVWNPENGSKTNVNSVPDPDWNAVAYDPADGDLYIADPYDDLVDVVNATTYATLDSYPVGTSPDYVAFDPSGDLILVANAGSNNLTILNGSTASAGAGAHGSVAAGIDPTSITVVAALDQVYVEDAGSGSVVVYATHPSIRSVPRSVETDVGIPISIPVVAAGGSGALSYSYTGLPSGCASADTPILTCTPTLNGSYEVTVTVTDSAGVRVTASPVPVTVSADPILAIAEAPPILEGAGTVTFGAVITGGTAPYSVVWSFGDGTNGTGAGTTHAYGTVGRYPVTAVLTDAMGSTARATAVVVDSGGPTIGAMTPGGSDPVGKLLDFTGNVREGVGPFTFNWSFGDGTTLVTGGTPAGDENVSNVTHTYQRPGTYGWVLTVTDGSGASLRLNGSIAIVNASKSSPPAPFPYAPVLLGAADAAALVAIAVMLLRRRRERAAPAPTTG